MSDTLNVYRDQGGPDRPKDGSGILWLSVLLLCAIGAAAAWFAIRPKEEPKVAAAPPDAGAPAKPTLPPTSVTDARVLGVGKLLSPEAAWAEWLGQADLVRTFTTVVYNVSEGESPRTRLSFLGPKDPFKTLEKKEKKPKEKKIFIDPASYARYDVVGAVIGTLNAQGVAAAYKELLPWFRLAFEEIAPKGADFGAAWSKATTRLLNVPVPQGEVEVVAKGAVFAYADPALESLSVAEKHLLRMGPQNQKLIQDKIREVLAAIQGPTATATADGGTTTTGAAPAPASPEGTTVPAGGTAPAK